MWAKNTIYKIDILEWGNNTIYKTDIEPERSSPVKLLPDLGFEETTSKEFTGCEGRGAMGGCTDLRGAIWSHLRGHRGPYGAI